MDPLGFTWQLHGQNLATNGKLSGQHFCTTWNNMDATKGQFRDNFDTSMTQLWQNIYIILTQHRHNLYTNCDNYFSFKIFNERCKSNLKSLGHFQAQLVAPPPWAPGKPTGCASCVQGLICNTKLTDNPHCYSWSYFKRPPCFIPIGVPSLPHNANISKLALKKDTLDFLDAV